MFRIQKLFVVALIGSASLAASAKAGIVTINSNEFDLDQFAGASVTYREDGGVDFDGKLWDNAAGVNLYTLGELASGQYGSDPGDQVSLTSRSTPDWLQLNYGGSGVEITSGFHQFFIYEITSSASGVDPEGTSFQVQFNGGTWFNANEGVVSFFDAAGLPSPPTVENTNQIMFDLLSFGFLEGDSLQTVRIQNLNTGSSTSDPDFIFAAVASTQAVPEPTSLALFGLGGAGLLMAGLRRRKKSGAESVSV